MKRHLCSAINGQRWPLGNPGHILSPLCYVPWEGHPAPEGWPEAPNLCWPWGGTPPGGLPQEVAQGAGPWMEEVLPQGCFGPCPAWGQEGDGCPFVYSPLSDTRGDHPIWAAAVIPRPTSVPASPGSAGEPVGTGVEGREEGLPGAAREGNRPALETVGITGTETGDATGTHPEGGACAVAEAVGGAVAEAVGGAVAEAVSGAVAGPVGHTVAGAVGCAVAGPVSCAVDEGGTGMEKKRDGVRVDSPPVGSGRPGEGESVGREADSGVQGGYELFVTSLDGPLGQGLMVPWGQVPEISLNSLPSASPMAGDPPCRGKAAAEQPLDPGRSSFLDCRTCPAPWPTGNTGQGVGEPGDSVSGDCSPA